MKRLKRITHVVVLRRSNVWNLFNGFLALMWGVWLLAPFKSMRTEGYRGLIEAADMLTFGLVDPEIFWGVCMAALGFYAIYSVGTNGDRISMWCNFALAGFWTSITRLFFEGSPYSTAIATYGSLAVFSWVMAFAAKERIRLEEGHHDE